ncbi:MAG TPA: nucleotide disphospho-sugar-binding domain-containing protein [Mycobacterium sp.]|nr:nucleotide disphospho-sugar-binding domain-containing protein [Mycobacterium sp.]
MATILAYTSPALGNLYPMCALLSALRDRGHRITVRTLARGLHCAGQLGFDVEAIDESIESIEMTDWMAANGREALAAAFRVFGERAPFEVDDLNAAIRREAPDAVIVDPNAWGAAAAAEASGLPWAMFYPYTPLVTSSGTPPFGPGITPWRGSAGRVRDRLLRPFVTKAAEAAMLEPVNAVRISLGLPTVGSADELARRTPLTLVASAEPFQYAGFLTEYENFAMIGPCDFDPPVSGGSPRFDDISRPIVLVTTSSDRQADDALGLTAIAALADEPVHVVATFPCGVPEPISLPDNATAVEFVPHGRVLDRAVCAITHGGMGVTQKALSRGVPVCVVPYGRDQFEVARRVEVAGCGTRLPASRLSVTRLKVKALQAMSKTEGPRRVAAGFAATGGVEHGADLVEQRLLTR